MWGRGMTSAEWPTHTTVRSFLSCRQYVLDIVLERFEAGFDALTTDDLVAVVRALELPLWFFFEIQTECTPTVCLMCGALLQSQHPEAAH